MIWLLLACASAPDRTTSTRSESLPGLAEREAFLEEYVTFDRDYEDLRFTIDFRDNAGGWVPGPSEWAICVWATVPADQVESWVAGLAPAEAPQPDPCDLATGAASATEWFAGAGVAVGIDRERRQIRYANLAS